MSQNASRSGADDTSASGAAVATAATFAKLKRDLLFHEKRINLLYSTRVLDDLGTVLTEHIAVREECDDDCHKAMAKLERDATEARMSGHWDEGKVFSMFQLEVPLRNVVGSNKFEAPPLMDTKLLEDLAAKTQAGSQRHAAFAHPDGEKALQGFVSKSKNAAFTVSDVSRMRDAVSAKLQVIQELDDLLAVIQESSVKVAKERAELEQLRRAEDRARADGEVALSEDAINERLAILQRIVDLQFFQIHTIDSTVEANVKRQRCNLSQFQSAAAMLECLQDEKRSLVEGCANDLNRIERGMAYELQATDTGRGHALRLIEESGTRITELSERQRKLCQRLVDLARLFDETEHELRDVAQERYQRVSEHVELVEGSRHATLDYMELRALANQYAQRLQNTKQQHQQGVDALQSLSSLMLQGQTFAEYDFKASARRLGEMQRRLCLELNEAGNEFELHGMEILRRKELLVTRMNEEIEIANCEAETRKEVFDPAAKRYVTKARDLSIQRDALQAEIDSLAQRLDEQRLACRTKVREQLLEEEVASVDKETELRRLMHKEQLLDLRQELLHSRESQQTTDIIDERSALAREITSEKFRPQKAPMLPSGALKSSATPTPTSMPAARQSTPSSSQSSRVSTIRAEVQRAKALPKLPVDAVNRLASVEDLKPKVNDDLDEEPAEAVPDREDPLALRRTEGGPRVISAAKAL